MAARRIDAGWNAGIFTWGQFSDETTEASGAWFDAGPLSQGVLDTEAKVWTVDGSCGMRWHDWDDIDPLPFPDRYSAAPPAAPALARCSTKCMSPH